MGIQCREFFLAILFRAGCLKVKGHNIAAAKIFIDLADRADRLIVFHVILLSEEAPFKARCLLFALFGVRIQDLDGQRRALEDLRRDNARETARIRDTYVKYEEFVRLQTSIDAKLSQIYELLAGGRR